MICSRNRERVAPGLEETNLLIGSVLLLKIRNNHRKLLMKTSIYSLHDEHGALRNIGITKHPLKIRLRGHLSEARRGEKNHRCCWIRSMLKRGFTPTIELITEVQEINGPKAEIAYIAYYRKLGFDLVNGTDGGDGTTGHISWNKGKKGLYCPTEEAKKKQSKALKGHEVTTATRLKISVKLTGIIRSEKARTKMSIARIGKPPWNKGKKGVQIAWNKNKTWPKTARQNMSIAHTGLQWSPARREAYNKKWKPF